MSNLKWRLPKKYEAKRNNINNHYQFLAFQIYSTTSKNEFLMWFFLQVLMYLRLSKILNKKKILNRKIINIQCEFVFKNSYYLELGKLSCKLSNFCQLNLRDRCMQTLLVRPLSTCWASLDQTIPTSKYKFKLKLKVLVVVLQ